MAALAIGLTVILATPATAQTRREKFDINAGDLRSALERYAAITGQAIDLRGLDIAGMRTKGASGPLLPDEALRRLLSGTHLRPCRGSGASIVVVPRDAPCVQGAADNRPDDIIVTGTSISHLAATNSTGTRMDADPLTLPMAISTVSEELLQKQQSLTLADAVTNVAGVVPTYDGYFNLRGFGLGTMRNGNASADQRADDLPNIAISRLEVVKGPEAIIAGVTAGYGGVVNIITKTPPSKPTAEVTGTVGTRGYYDLGADLGGPLNKDGSVAVRLVASTQDSAHNAVGYDGASTDYVSPSVTFRNNRWGTVITGQFEYQRFRRPPQMIVYTNKDRLAGDLPLAKTGPDSDGVRVEKKTTSITLDQKIVGDWTLSVKYQHEDRRQNTVLANSFISGAFGFPFPNVMSFGTKGASEVTLDTVKVEIRGKVVTGPIKHNLLFAYDHMKAGILQGGQLTSISTTNTETGKTTDLTPIYGPIFGIPTPWSSGGANPLQTGKLVLDQMEWGDLYVLAGWRGMSYDSRNINLPLPKFKKSLPSLGILYRITPELSVYASAAKAFTPNLGLYNISGNPVAPEDAQQFEGGVKALLFDKRIAATLSVYRIKQKNVAIADPVNRQPVCGGTACYVTVPGVRSTGVEMELSGDILPRLELRANYSYDDKKAPASGFTGLAYAHHTGSLWATYHFGKEEGLGPWAGLGLQARSKRISTDAIYTASNPGNVRLDLSAGYDSEKWSFVAGVKNALNGRIYTIDSGSFGTGVVTQLREAYATLRYKFR